MASEEITEPLVENGGGNELNLGNESMLGSTDQEGPSNAMAEHNDAEKGIPEAEETAATAEEATEASPSESVEKDEDAALVEPHPVHPLLKSVAEAPPPTPRDSSPLHIAMEHIHPSRLSEEGHLLSPTERKEADVQSPHEVCDFRVVHESYETEEGGTADETDPKPTEVDDAGNDCDPVEPAAENSHPQEQTSDEHSLDQGDPTQQDVGEEIALEEMEVREETVGPASEGSPENHPGKNVEELSTEPGQASQDDVQEAPPEETEVKEESVQPEPQEPVKEATPKHVEAELTVPPQTITSGEPASIEVSNQIFTESTEDPSGEPDVVPTGENLDGEAEAPSTKHEHPPGEEIDPPAETTPEMATHVEDEAVEAQSYEEIPEVEPVGDEIVPTNVDEHHASDEPDAVATQQVLDEKDVAESDETHASPGKQLGEPAEKTPEIETHDKEEDPGDQAHAEPVADVDVASEVETMPTTVDESYSPEDPRDDDEYVVISQDEVPMEYAEEYPPIQMQNSEIFHPPEAEGEVTLDDLAAHYPLIEEEKEPAEESEGIPAATYDEPESTSHPETTAEHVPEEEAAKPEQSELVEHHKLPPSSEIAPQEVVEDQLTEHAQDESAGAVDVQDAEDIPAETPRSFEAESRPAEVVPQSVGFQAPLDVVPSVNEAIPEESALDEEPLSSVEPEPESALTSDDLKDEEVAMDSSMEPPVTHEVEEVGNPEGREEPVEDAAVDDSPIEHGTVHEEEQSHTSGKLVVDAAVHETLTEPQAHEAIPQVAEPLIENEIGQEQVTGVSPESEAQGDNSRIREPRNEQEIGHEIDAHELSHDPGPTEDIPQLEEDPVEYDAALQESKIAEEAPPEPEPVDNTKALPADSVPIEGRSGAEEEAQHAEIAEPRIAEVSHEPETTEEAVDVRPKTVDAIPQVEQSDSLTREAQPEIIETEANASATAAVTPSHDEALPAEASGVEHGTLIHEPQTEAEPEATEEITVESAAANIDKVPDDKSHGQVADEPVENIPDVAVEESETSCEQHETTHISEPVPVSEPEEATIAQAIIPADEDATEQQTEEVSEALEEAPQEGSVAEESHPIDEARETAPAQEMVPEASEVPQEVPQEVFEAKQGRLVEQTLEFAAPDTVEPVNFTADDDAEAVEDAPEPTTKEVEELPETVHKDTETAVTAEADEIVDIAETRGVEDHLEGPENDAEVSTISHEATLLPSEAVVGLGEDEPIQEPATEADVSTTENEAIPTSEPMAHSEDFGPFEEPEQEAEVSRGSGEGIVATSEAVEPEDPASHDKILEEASIAEAGTSIPLSEGAAELPAEIMQQPSEETSDDAVCSPTVTAKIPEAPAIESADSEIVPSSEEFATDEQRISDEEEPEPTALPVVEPETAVANAEDEDVIQDRYTNEVGKGIQDLEPGAQLEMIADSEVSEPKEMDEEMLEVLPPKTEPEPPAAATKDQAVEEIHDKEPVREPEVVTDSEVAAPTDQTPEDAAEPARTVEEKSYEVPAAEIQVVPEAITQQKEVDSTESEPFEAMPEATTMQKDHNFSEEETKDRLLEYSPAVGAAIVGGMAIKGVEARHEGKEFVSAELPEADESPVELRRGIDDEAKTFETANDEELHHDHIKALEESIIPQKDAAEPDVIPELDVLEKSADIEHVPAMTGSTETISVEAVSPAVGFEDIPAHEVEPETSERRVQVDTPVETKQISTEVSLANNLSEEKMVELPAVSEDATAADESPGSEPAGEGIETPIGKFVQGTMAPPSSPSVSKSVLEVPSGLIAASVRSLSNEGLNQLEPVEAEEQTGMEDQPVVVDDVSPVQPQESAAREGETIREPASLDTDVVEPVTERSVVVGEIPTPKDEDSHEAMETAATGSIPAVLAAGTIGLVATATQHKPSQQEPADSEEVPPLIRVVSPNPPSLAVQGPFVEPLKHHIQPEEISPILPPQDSQKLSSPFFPVPAEPTRLPTGRPSTSYSWIGHLFQPISPEIIEAQRSGWVAVSTEIVNEPPVRRHSSRLKRRLKRLSRTEGTEGTNQTETASHDPRGCGIM